METSIPVTRQNRYLEPSSLASPDLLGGYMSSIQQGYEVTLTLWNTVIAQAMAHELHIELEYYSDGNEDNADVPDKSGYLRLNVVPKDEDWQESKIPRSYQMRDPDDLDNLFYTLAANGQHGVFQDFLLSNWAIIEQLGSRSQFDRWLQVDIY